MRTGDQASRKAFLWQAILIVLPVLGLAVVALLSLKQDQRLAEIELRERATEIARNLAQQFSLGFSAEAVTNGAVTFTISKEGKLLAPPPIRGYLASEPATRDLSDLQLQLWTAARKLEFQDQEPAGAIEAWEKFLESKPPGQFLGLAWHALATLNLERDPARAIQWYQKLAALKSGDAGHALSLLARVRLLELSPPTNAPAADLNSLCRELVENPTPSTGNLLAKLRQLKFGGLAECEARWQTEETARRVYLAARKELADCLQGNRTGEAIACWFMNGELTLATLSAGTSTNRLVNCRTASDLHETWRTLTNHFTLPPYLAVSAEVAGMALGNLSSTNAQLVATSPANGTPRLRTQVYLTKPELWRSGRTARARWYGAFITLAATTACAGLVATWRTFERERKLGESRGNFVSSVSHELRAPITAIRLLAEGLERGRMTDPARHHEYYRLIARECRRLSSLIENVLDFSRLEKGRRQFTFERTDVAQLVEHALQILQPFAAEKQVQLRLLSSPEPKELHTIALDERAIQQALVNLLDNAVKHSPPGAEVKVGLEHNPASDEICIWVEDRGPGIPNEDHARIFERFYRRGSELRRETEGIGIGLTIAKQMVDAHGGRIEVRSAPGQGSRFTIHLPAQPKPPLPS